MSFLEAGLEPKRGESWQKKLMHILNCRCLLDRANPSPPVGPALGQHGLNIMEFCKAFNADTQGMEPGLPIPVVITVYNDKSFTFQEDAPSIDFVEESSRYPKWKS